MTVQLLPIILPIYLSIAGKSEYSADWMPVETLSDYALPLLEVCLSFPNWRGLFAGVDDLHIRLYV